MPDNKLSKLYIYYVLLLLPAVLSQIGGFNPSQEEISNVYEKGSLISRIYLPIILFWTLYISRTKEITLLWTKYELLLIGYFLLGVTYSATPYNVLRGSFTAVTILFMWNTIAKLMVAVYSLDEIVQTFIKFVIIYGVIECILWYLDTSRMIRYGDMGQYLGYLQQPNIFAKVISVGFIFNIFYLLSKKVNKTKYWISCSILLLFLLGSGSRTSLIAIVFSALLTIIIVEKIRIKYVLSVIIIGSLGYFLFGSFISDFFIKIDDYTSPNLFEANSFLYRIRMWVSLVPEMFNNFWFGAGLNSFWTPSIIFEYNLYLSGIHNGILQVFQDLGFIGLILTISIHLPLLKPIIKSNVNDSNQCFRKIFIAIWIYFAIVNITEGDLGNYRSFLWGILVVLSIYYSLIFNNARPDEKLECNKV